MSINRKSAFTLVELMVVISIIVLVTGLTVPLMTQFFDKQKLPRAAKVLSSYIRNAQVSSVNYLMETQIEIIPGTDDQVRTWGYSARCKYPTSNVRVDMDWDRPADGYTLITEARRLSKAGGTVRFLPLNPYSYEPQNIQEYKNPSSNAWEFSELRYSHYSLENYERSGGQWEITPGLQGLKFNTGTDRAGTHKIALETAVGIQVLLGSAKHMPKGVGIDPVNYVTYVDNNGDGMPDGNPLGLAYDKDSALDNKNKGLFIGLLGSAIPANDIWQDYGTRKPKKISGSLMFTTEGTLKRNFSLCYYSKNPVNLAAPAYFKGAPGFITEAMMYGFCIFDKSAPQKRMFIEVTGVGQVRKAFAVYPPQDKKWGENFDYTSPTG
ncbi:Tfp pilus assembly protein FimT/FimU [Planctomycetota bacterium]